MDECYVSGAGGPAIHRYDRSTAGGSDLAKVRVQIVGGRFFETREEESRTFEELMERHLAEHAARKAQPRHYRGYVKTLTAFFGGDTLAEITPKVIVDYKNQRYAAGLKPASINRELATLKKAFNLAVKEWEWCRDNPVSRVSMEREHNKRDRWLSREEEARLLDACAPWLHDLVTLRSIPACGWGRLWT